jgi:acyl-CoA thioesterase I
MKTHLLYFISFLVAGMLQSFEIKKEEAVKYLPLGDSYTICTGAAQNESWPLLLTQHLNDQKVITELLDNPARNGFTTRNLIDLELPLVKKLKPTFVTLVQEVPAETYQKNLDLILDEVQNQLPDKKKLLLITIPDFGVTPSGKNYGGGRNISNGISGFNDIIKAVAKKRGLRVVDIFGISKAMQTDASLVAKDGLHPSAKEYAIWEKLILPEALQLLKSGEGK